MLSHREVDTLRVLESRPARKGRSPFLAGDVLASIVWALLLVGSSVGGIIDILTH